jgi:hypothetical protein
MLTPNLVDVFGRSVRVLAANPLDMFGLGALAAILQGLIWLIRPLFLGQIVSTVFGELVFAAIVSASARAASGDAANAFESLDAVRGRIGALLELLGRQLGAAILLAITVVGIPFSIRILVRWFFGTQALVLRGLDPKQSIALSCQLANRRWWWLAGTIFLFAVALGAPQLFVGWYLGRPESLVVTVPLSAILVPLVGCFWTLVFLDLEAVVRRVEGDSLHSMTL